MITLVGYELIDGITGKNDPILLKIYVYSNENKYIVIDTDRTKWFGNLPIIIEPKGLRNITIKAVPRKCYSFFPLYINDQKYLIPVYCKEVKKEEEKKEYYDVNVSINDTIKVCVNGQFNNLKYLVRIDDRKYSGLIPFPTCLEFPKNESPGKHNVYVSIQNSKTIEKELTYYVKPIFFYTINYKPKIGLLKEEIEIILKTYGNTKGKVEFCAKDLCIKGEFPPNIERVYRVKYDYSLYFAIGLIAGLSLLGLYYYLNKKRIKVNKNYTLEGNIVKVTLEITNKSLFRVKGYILDPIPKDAEVEILTNNAKIKDIAGNKFVYAIYDLMPGETLVIAYKLKMPFEITEIDLPKPIVL
ncbi:NEQ504 [Nanoarchaeum equitans Kin4-M]|uniref:NEQ504 n=1 Tax=Nanoarchaeum equitans (strain Kin4-M) TaxID=228908 RepID=Q74MV9_NANEQ|nr:NEQ504 [Nanoarchaeum equitans Kin4-M]